MDSILFGAGLLFLNKLIFNSPESDILFTITFILIPQFLALWM